VTDCTPGDVLSAHAWFYRMYSYRSPTYDRPLYTFYVVTYAPTAVPRGKVYIRTISQNPLHVASITKIGVQMFHDEYWN